MPDKRTKSATSRLPPNFGTNNDSDFVDMVTDTIGPVSENGDGFKPAAIDPVTLETIVNALTERIQFFDDRLEECYEGVGNNRRFRQLGEIIADWSAVARVFSEQRQMNREALETMLAVKRRGGVFTESPKG